MTESTWTRRRVDKADRLSAIARYVDGKLIDHAAIPWLGRARPDSGEWPRSPDCDYACFEMLDVAVASHGPVQRETARVVAKYLSTIPRHGQQAAYMTNVGARRIRDDSAAVLDDLANAVAHPVRWFDIMRLLPELGIGVTVEMPPGDVLSRLVTATTPALSVFSVTDDELGAIAARLRSLPVDAVPKPDHRAQDFLGPT